MTDQSNSMPTESFFREVLTEQGICLSEERLAAALLGHRGARPQIDRLRAVAQSFLDPVLEPASALLWLEAGGVTL